MPENGALHSALFLMNVLDIVFLALAVRYLSIRDLETALNSHC